MMRWVLAFSMMGLFSVQAMADGGSSHVCKSGKVERTVSVVYEQEGKKVPCSVKYKRDPAEDEKELYKAQAEEGFCESKADEFVKKLASNGWECSSAN